MDSVRFKFEGGKELVSRLNSLDRKIKRRIATKAVRAGAKIMVKALRTAVPKDSGAARKAIGTKVKTYRNSGVTVAITGERISKRGGKEKETKAKFGGPHLHLIEYGTQERFRYDVARKAGFTRSQIEAAMANNLIGWRGIGVSKSTVKKARRIGGLHLAMAQRAIRRGGSTGRVRPRPFFKRTVLATASAARAAQIEVLRREIPAAAKGA